MWLASKKGCKNKIMNLEPIKILGAYISYDQQNNNEANFFSRIQKMKTRLNMWQTRPVTSSFYTDILKWFNTVNNLNLIPLNEQILFHIKDEKCKLTNAQERRLDVLLLYTKYYLYTCKTLFKMPNSVELQRKIDWQWKIENCSSV